MSADPILSAILAHARKRWCWDDESMLVELYERLYGEGDTPAAFVDALAVDYGLIDPREFQFNQPQGTDE